MDAMESSSPYSLRQKLRTTVCGCFGSPSSPVSSAGRPHTGGGRARWRRRMAATGVFRYDPLSYALNFDNSGSDGGERDTKDTAFHFQYRNFSSRLPPLPTPTAGRATTVAIA
ncbi:hypothetical protein CFC21_054633 [Triticum aestivum]|uniref:Uncharacterized protein n=2 Tax=Triticum aestivum TaxID=4565 RepID=A0A3B6I025_WHEAT|nr:uncharacterized protein LOC123087953 [Triticum aestivum]KAF7045535.1 hypothetical protein CFC21_054633 [Triticum aestivum]